MRRLRRNHHKQPTIDRLGGAPGPPRVPAASTPASRLGVAPGALRVPVAPAPTSRLGAALGPPRVAWAPPPASRRRTTPRAPRVPVAPVPTSRLRVAPGPSRVAWAPAPAQGSSGGTACPHDFGPDENCRAEQLRKHIKLSAVFDPIVTGTAATKEPTRLSDETAAACLVDSGGSLPAAGRCLSTAVAGHRAATRLE
jgi:hypothetical protein